ncbi:hypothetical protein [Deinococcus maricopensis]|uniref:Uncharacterized protein n=1 Tax=Deinococcus maricopensis (strain DSM 21211 / LMG 22137 / NRRL B-23946 / LB-34) TaxID=709986 RepID=E8UBZ9_DEIML|nr:hypothetical protein [Deinococcus maricopensis]ADV68588.1 hypothetical protein Deima_2959 [Deinococcus maricopensis DSM 21211]
MTDPRPKPQRSGGGRGRPVLWFVLLASFVGATAGTIAITKANPLYSNAERNGISKYRFIEDCKDEIHQQISEIEKNANAQSGGKQTLNITPEFNASRLVQATGENPNAGGWYLQSEVNLVAPGIVRPTPFACGYDPKATGKKLQAQLQLQ